MLSLDSPRWSELQHAYGPASDIPNLLRQLEALPSAEGDSEPWFSLWSSLAHEGDVYPASFAAVPHVVRVLSGAPASADSSFFQFPAWVEICRQKKAVSIHQDLRSEYFAALSQLPALVAAASSREWCWQRSETDPLQRSEIDPPPGSFSSQEVYRTRRRRGCGRCANRRGRAVEGGRGGGPGAGLQAPVGTADRGPRWAGAAERSDAGGPRWVRSFHQARHLP
jgi:hypothetical protein